MIMTSNKITITRKNCATGTYAVYRGDAMIATIHSGKPTLTNGRRGTFNVCRMTGRVDWFESFRDARNDALKG